MKHNASSIKVERPGGAAGSVAGLGVYIHIPFCRQKCLYCDFPSSASCEHLFDRYIAALCREIQGRGGLLSAYEVDTVYFGGGTPTLLPAESLSRIMTCLRQNAFISPGAEITTEANPGTLSPSYLEALRLSGFNRLSIGVQSFDDNVLAAAGRIHDARQALDAVMEAAGWFDNISVDLMYGLPRQTPDGFQKDMALVAELPVRHVSVYGLKVEDNTPFHVLQNSGKLKLPSEDEEAAMYELAVAGLTSRGFCRYEISNYARSGCACRHNLKYWHYQPYLGFGAAAHSFLAGERSANTGCIEEYIERMDRGENSVEYSENTDRENAMAEFVFLALRTADGLSVNAFNNYFKADFAGKFAKTVNELAEQGLLARSVDNIWLTALGMRYGNIVFARFLP